MPFNPQITAARLALDFILTDEMPWMACDALEYGLDGPAIRRLASYESPTFFEVQEILPAALKEMNLNAMKKAEAALVLGKQRAIEILNSGTDPIRNLQAF